jgi:hypothetical protein
MYNEVMEGSWQTRPMSKQFWQWAHDFVLGNSTHLAPWRQKAPCITINVISKLC